jgi:hypothetical protein
MGKKSDSSSSSSSSSDSEKEKKKEKKVKGKKPKSVIASSQTFSKRYSYLFNNKLFSDFTITIGEESFPAHKFILQFNSEFFQKLEGDSFKFSSEDDKTAAKDLIKFYYEGLYQYTDESQVVIFTLLANKVIFSFNTFSTKLIISKNSSYLQKFY